MSTSSISQSTGFVYVITYSESPNLYKIGHTGDLSRRFAALATASPFRVVLVHSIETSDPVGLERFLHAKYAKQRIKLEWFALSADDINHIKTINGAMVNSREKLNSPKPQKTISPSHDSQYSEAHKTFKELQPKMDEYFSTRDWDAQPKLSAEDMLNSFGYAIAGLSLDELLKLRGCL